MDAQRREIGRSIKRLRAALNVGDIQSFSNELQKVASTEMLTAIREQKLLVKPHSADRSAVTAVLKATAETVFCQAEADRYLTYLEFTEVWQRAHQGAIERLSAVVDRLPRMALSQLLRIYDRALDCFLQQMPSRPLTYGQTVAEYERRLHHLNGLANDIYYAALRALNEVSRGVLDPIEQRLSPAAYYPAIRHFIKVIQIAGELNGLEWVLDSVTYGDLVVSKVEKAPALCVRLDYADARRSLLHELAIRRQLILNLNRAKAPRYVGEMLKASEARVLKHAVEHYAELMGVEPTDVDLDKLSKLSAASLSWTDAEDDMLVLAGARVGDPRYATYYLSAMCLRWFELGAETVREALPTGYRRFLTAPPIPVSSLEAIIRDSGGVDVSQTFKDLSSELPARSHFDLVRRPFLRLPDGETRGLPAGGFSLWNTTVREALISGGEIGDAYGKIWEDFYAQSFQETDWCVVGRNLTLRCEGKTTTDVDLLLKRGDLLLVVEVKALIGSNVTCYDHWRNRQIIEKGCRQAAAAVEFIRSQQGWLVSVAGNKVAEEVRHIQPLVLTTVSMFDGWRFNGVPVIGEGGRKAITQGAKVDYTDAQTGRVVSTRWITKPEELSTERILWSLDNHVDMLIAPECLDVRHRAVTYPDLTALLPEFDLRKDVESIPVVTAAVESARSL